MKNFIIGLFVGATMILSTSAFADTTLQKVEAYLNPSLPITLDGNKLNLQNAPITYDGTTYLPLRDIATNLGKDVKWNDATQTVELSSKITNVNNTNTKGAAKMNEVFYNSNDITKALRYKYYNTDDMKLAFVTINIVGDKKTLTYQGREFEITNQNSYYDRLNDTFYYTDNFYLQFLPSGILDGIKKYSIDQNGTIAPLN